MTRDSDEEVLREVMREKESPKKKMPYNWNP